VSGKPLEFPDFSDALTPDSIKALNRSMMIVFVVNALLWGDVYSLVFFVVWILLCAAIFHYRRKPFLGRLAPILYIPVVFGLSLIEETAVYFNGGGLQGAATSISEDLVK